MSDIIKYEDVEKSIKEIRGQLVLIDRDVAKLYGVEPREINQAVKNNPDKFPDGYTIMLNKDEKNELIKNFDQFNSLKHAKAMPTAFTERGLYMLATILKGSVATQTTIAIVETFARLKEYNRIITVLPEVKVQAKQIDMVQKARDILMSLFADTGGLSIESDETAVELNFGIAKVKRSIKRGKRKEPKDED